jgi:hypothetical protein
MLEERRYLLSKKYCMAAAMNVLDPISACVADGQRDLPIYQSDVDILD